MNTCIKPKWLGRRRAVLLVANSLAQSFKVYLPTHLPTYLPTYYLLTFFPSFLPTWASPVRQSICPSAEGQIGRIVGS